MEKEILKEIGLTDSEVSVYLALLELGDSTRGDIVNKSEIAGSKVYEVLDKLQKKGLASVYSKNNVKHFKPTNPKQIISYLEDKEDSLLKTKEEAKSMLPNLLSLYATSTEESEVELIKGFKGLQRIFEEQIELLDYSDTCYVIGGTGKNQEEKIQIFFEKIHILREEKGIKTKILFNEGQKKSTKKAYNGKKFPRTKIKYINHTSPVAINIYQDRTVIIIFGKEINAIYIRSSEVANSFQEYFNLLWSQ